MIKKSIVTLFLLLAINPVKAQDAEQMVIGTKQVLRSAILNEDRGYWISLPDSYNRNESYPKSYPVLFVLDGNMHFKALAGLVNYMSSDAYRSWKIPEMIVVGIENVDRRRDYTPDKVVTVRANNSGGGKRFLRFLEEELIPELDQNYRTEPYRILFGHSLGGLLATHAYMQEKSLFRAFLAVDPSLGTWDAETMDKKVEAVTPQSFERYLYLATANWGKRNRNNRDRHIRLYEALHSKCEGAFPAKLDYFENESHASVPPIAFYQGLSSLFEGYGISYRDVESKAQLVHHFQLLSKRLSWSVTPPERLVDQIGYNLLRSRDASAKEEALDFFLLNTANFPHSYHAFNSLGASYEALGDTGKAIETYTKSLELNPDNEQARAQLESLGKIE